MSTAKQKPKLSVVQGAVDKPTSGPELSLTTKFQAIFDQASDAILVLRPNGQIDEVNRAFEELTGFLKEELTNFDLGLIIPKKSHRIPDRSRSIRPDFFEQQGIFEDVAVLRKDGYVRLVDLSVRQVESDGETLSLALFRDVTAKKQMERELITKHAELRDAYFRLEKANMELKSTQDTLVQAGKMAALGELTAGIAHEINQPLTGIRGYAQELTSMIEPDLKSLKNSNEVDLCLKEIVSNVDKVAKIIIHLRNFTTKNADANEKVSVHEAIEESLKMVSRQFQSHGIEVETHFGKEIPSVYANPIQLEQVFINLATNARDAIDSKGNGKGKISIKTSKKKDFVEVEYRDDGCGMSEKTQSRIFNPFYTTKEVGKGMGLGMSLSYGILNRIHGNIMVESEVGKGTKFLIRIPIDFREIG